MKELISKVEEFNASFNIPSLKEPSLIGDSATKLRYELMKEENEEYLEANSGGDIVGIADAIGDKLYVLVGDIVAHGLQDKIGDIFNEIHRSNMSKLGDSGKPILRDDGKVMKSSNYFKPNLRGILLGEGGV